MLKTKQCIWASLVVLLIMLCTATWVLASNNQGSLVIVGGGLDPDNAEVYNKIVEMAGGPANAKIAIIPAANSKPAYNGLLYKEDFIRYGVPADQITVIPLAVDDDPKTDDVDESTWVDNGMSEEIATQILEHNAVYFMGGNQLNITATLLHDGEDTPVLRAIREVYRRGGVISGSSAGAAIMSQPMIGAGQSLGALLDGVTFEDNYFDPDDNRVFLTDGLGFFDYGMIDQHFVKRGRFGRLIQACYYKEYDLGIGIDENTCIVVKDDTVEVFGESGIIIVDLSTAERIQSDAFGLEEVLVSYLEKGDRYHLIDKSFVINPEKESTMGYEYYEGNSLYTDVFATDAIKQMITEDLIDNTATEVEGISFNMEDATNGNGVKITFYETKDSDGYWGKVDGKNSYAVLNIMVDIKPIGITIEEVK